MRVSAQSTLEPDDPALLANARMILGPESSQRQRERLGLEVLNSFGRFFVEIPVVTLAHDDPLAAIDVLVDQIGDVSEA